MFEVDALDNCGPGNVVYDLATKLNPKLFKVVLVSMSGRGYIAEELRKKGILVEILPEKEDRSFRLLLEHHGIHLLFAHHSFFGTPIAHRMNVPVLSAFHDVDFLSKPDIMSLIQKQDPCVNRYTVALAEVRDLIGDRFKIDPQKISVIPSGIDSDSQNMVHSYEMEMLGVIAEAGKNKSKEAGEDSLKSQESSRNVSPVKYFGHEYQDYLAGYKHLVSEQQRILKILSEQEIALRRASEERSQIQLQISALLGPPGQQQMIALQLQTITQKLDDLALMQHNIVGRLSIKERIRSTFGKLLRRGTGDTYKRDAGQPAESPEITGTPGKKDKSESLILQDVVQNRLDSKTSRDPEPIPNEVAEELMVDDIKPQESASEIEPRSDFPKEKTHRYAILCFPIIDWEFRFQRPQQLLTRFADAGHPVYYSMVLMDTALDPYYLRPLRENVFEIKFSAPRSVNIYLDPLDEGLTAHLARSVGILIHEQDLHEVVMLVQFPGWRLLARQLASDYGWKIIYDCMNENTGLSRADDRLFDDEENLLRESDLVVTSGAKLLEKAKQFNKNVMYLPNATDFEHFANPRPNGEVSKSSQILGYFGAMAEWFDYDSVLLAAQQHREWKFLLIGGHHSPEVEKLKGQPNIVLTGEVPYQQLPGYLAYFDVCLIPMRLTPLIESANPVKFFEYLCTGKPIVTADFPELRTYADLYYPYTDRTDFQKKILTALQETGSDIKHKRIETARNNQWNDRVLSLSERIDTLLPKISVIVLSYNNCQYIKMCLDSIRRNSLYPNLEIIVVDNGSDLVTVNLLKELEREWPQLKVIFNEKNLGFAHANNQAAKIAKGDYLVLLNDDVVVTKGWLTGLMRHLRKPGTGMVGPVTNSCANEACISVTYTDIKDMDEFARGYIWKNRGRFFEIEVLALFCTMIPRHVWDAVGLLDERYEVGMFEDDDYALRVRQQGLKLICAQDVFVHHFGWASFSRMDYEEYKKLFDSNQLRFEQKWGRSWTGHQRLYSGPR